METHPDTLPAIAEDAAPVCAVCGGAGFVRRDRPVDHPRFGKAEPCDCVLDEATDVRRDRLQRLSNLGSLTRFSFETLIPAGRDGTSEWFRAGYTASRAFAEEPANWIVFTGPSGSGKTHLAAAIANERIGNGLPALFMVVPDLLDHLRASYDAADDEMGFEQLFEQVRNAPLLILDDIDAVAGTAWAKEKLFQVLNHRYNAALPTVFTTTTPPQQLDGRLATRLCDEAQSRVLPLDGPVRGGYLQVGGMTRERLEEMQFRDFIVPSSLRPEEQASLRAGLSAARDYAEAPGGWLVLLGANGSGKTHLAAAIANRMLGRGDDVFFAVVPDLLDHLRASFAPQNESTYDETFEQLRAASLLVLDDLGSQKSSPWAEEKLYQIVNFRTLSRLPTVVTSDLRPEGLRTAYPRIHARILDPQRGNRIELLAPHYSLGRATAPARATAPGRDSGPKPRGRAPGGG